MHCSGQRDELLIHPPWLASSPDFGLVVFQVVHIVEAEGRYTCVAAFPEVSRKTSCMKTEFDARRSQQ